MILTINKYVINKKKYDITLYYFSTKKNKKYIPPVWILHDSMNSRYFVCGHLYFIQHFLDKKFYKNGFKSKTNAFEKLKELTEKFDSVDKKLKKRLSMINSSGNDYPRSPISDIKGLYENFKLRKRS